MLGGVLAVLQASKFDGLSIATPPSRLAADAAFNDAKLKCAELGFKAGTEKYGTCVLTLSK
jgi:hypothetical protein